MTLQDVRQENDAAAQERARRERERDTALISRVSALVAGHPPEIALAAICDELLAAGHQIAQSVPVDATGRCVGRVERLRAMAGYLALPLTVVFDRTQGPLDAHLSGRVGETLVTVRADGDLWSWRLTDRRGRTETQGSSRQSLDGAGIRELAASVRAAVDAAAGARARRDAEAMGWLVRVMEALHGEGLAAYASGNAVSWWVLAGEAGGPSARVTVWFESEAMVWSWSAGAGERQAPDPASARRCGDPALAVSAMRAALHPSPPQAAAQPVAPAQHQDGQASGSAHNSE
jgi:hypothetical protein